EGETGTGKEVVARAVHALGRRAAGPFVPVNCAAVPETLAESEFFGHARGAFTGAVQERPGVLQLADRGTLFLDEVEDLVPALQAKLLRVVQDREVRPLGASSVRRFDVRIVAASNRDLWRMVEAGQFRRDLYYRLRVFAITLPPLRQRRDDLPALIEHFIARFNRAQGTTFALPPPGTLRPLLEHPWPGNVRELENVLESLLVLAGAEGVELAELLARRQAPAAGLMVDERARIVRVLDEHRWNRQRATTLHSVNGAPLVYRVVSNVNDLDGVEGMAPPGRVVELWYRQRNFKEGTDDASDPFAWCAWKNGGNAVRIGVATADAGGVWRLSDLRHAGTTVMLFPPGPGADRCLGGVYTELLPRACDQPGVNCSAWTRPTLHWLNV